jgi:hypothetical protein
MPQQLTFPARTRTAVQQLHVTPRQFLGVLLGLLGCVGAFWVGLNAFWLDARVAAAYVAAAILVCWLGWLAEARTRRSGNLNVDIPGAMALLVPLIVLAWFALVNGFVPLPPFIAIWLVVLAVYVLHVAVLSWRQRWFTVAPLIVLAGPLGVATLIVGFFEACARGFCL